jgi:hypothetical protein
VTAVSQSPELSNLQKTDYHQLLLERIHDRLPALTALLDDCDREWVSEDLIYRFWHASLKVFALQSATERIVAELEALCPPGCQLHPWFRDAVDAGTGLTFKLAMNDDWPRHARPIVDAFFHARFMLTMAVRHGSALETAPRVLPSGWAALLELYGIR